jgi:uncharacterized C2H2 Zn-finger protein
MVAYTCNNCNKLFKQKIDYERHINRKNKCLKINTTINELNNILLENPPIGDIIPPINTNIPPIINKEVNALNKCMNCNKQFSRCDSYKRHVLFRCKFIDEPITKDDNIVIELLSQLNNNFTEQITKMEEENKKYVLFFY